MAKKWLMKKMNQSKKIYGCFRHYLRAIFETENFIKDGYLRFFFIRQNNFMDISRDIEPIKIIV